MPPVFASWANSLRRSPGAVLWLLQFPQLASQNLGRQASAAGVATRRIYDAPTAERSFHLARAAHADLFLDTAPYSGHTTSGDALWMGAAMVTLPGRMMQSRVAAGYSANAGCPQFTVRSARAYEDLVAAVVAKPSLAAEMKRCLARTRFTRAAFDTRRWVRAFDLGVHMMWETHKYGLGPMHLLTPARHMMGA